MLYLPRDGHDRHRCERLAEQIVAEHGLRFLGWRNVPTDNSRLGEGARYLEPVIRQLFVARPAELADEIDFERRLYVCRRHLANTVRAIGPAFEETFYVCSFSGRTIVYKGMLTPPPAPRVFSRPAQPGDQERPGPGPLALLHQHLSQLGPCPSLSLPGPQRRDQHPARQRQLDGAPARRCCRPRLGDDWAKILPVIDETGSDSAMFDNCLEFLHLSGRSLPHAVMMMIPEPWSRHGR